MRRIFTVLILFLLSISFVVAHKEDTLAQGEAIVEQKTSCDSLSDDQLEAVGELYMEQMHPGALHDAMHTAMGLEEGTEEHKEFHVLLAQRMYCGENVVWSGMPGGYGMMGMMYGNWGWFFLWFFWILLFIIIFAAVFALVFWLVWKSLNKKKR
ncbi:MAG TPA: hypothetical protein VJJ79_00130 [Candidatus Nanoarchaeia archaeon]|nr:hypothetical protein [Candidatus Nanoarchaeia archaeon]